MTEAMATPTTQRCFIITSYGRTATTWLAAALNQHPEIMCSHGPVLPERYFLQKPALAEVHGGMDDFFSIPVDRHYDVFLAMAKGRVCGNVHGYALDWLVPEFRRNPPRRDYVVINMTRHPVTRIESLFRGWQQQADRSPELIRILGDMHRNELWQATGRAIRDRFPGTFDRLKDWIFLTALLKTVTTDAVELRMEEYRHFTMEEVTADPSGMHRLIDLLLPGADVGDTTSLFAQTQRVNQSTEVEKSAEEVWTAWPEWKREVFRRVPDWCGVDARALYRKFGYASDRFFRKPG
jgi:hypothetical protein